MSFASRIGLGFSPTDTRQALHLIARAEAAAIGTAWTVMSPIDRDTVTVLAAAAAQTARINLGTSVVPAFTRHPLALATQVLALEDLAPGRIRLGIGTSHQLSMISAYGLPFERPLAQLREYLQVIRPLLQEGSFSFAGDFYKGEAAFRSPPGTPVLISALGQKSFELAGEMADGAISWVCPPRYLQAIALPAMRRGAEKAGRPVPPLVAHVLVAPSPNIDRVREAARTILAYYLMRPFYRNMFAAAGYPTESDRPVSEELIDALVLSGDDQVIMEGLRQRLEEWADELVIGIVPVDDLRSAEERVLWLIGKL